MKRRTLSAWGLVAMVAAASALAAPAGPESRYPASTAPLKIDNDFTRANPDYKAKEGAKYETLELEVAAGQLAGFARLDTAKQSVAQAILRAFIYDYLDAKVFGNGTLTLQAFDKVVADMDSRFRKELSPEEFEKYLAWRTGPPYGGNSLALLMKLPSPDLFPGKTLADVKKILPPTGRETISKTPGKHWIDVYPCGPNREVRVVGATLRENPDDGDKILMSPFVRHLDDPDRGWKRLAGGIPTGTTLGNLKQLLPPDAKPEMKVRPFSTGQSFSLSFVLLYPLDKDFMVVARGLHTDFSIAGWETRPGFANNDLLTINRTPLIYPAGTSAADAIEKMLMEGKTQGDHPFGTIYKFETWKDVVKRPGLVPALRFKPEDFADLGAVKFLPPEEWWKDAVQFNILGPDKKVAGRVLVHRDESVRLAHRGILGVLSLYAVPVDYVQPTEGPLAGVGDVCFVPGAKGAAAAKAAGVPAEVLFSRNNVFVQISLQDADGARLAALARKIDEALLKQVEAPKGAAAPKDAPPEKAEK
jgi:hypothetical protein